MNIIIEKDDGPDDFEFFFNGLSSQDRSEFYKLVERLKTLTERQEKIVFSIERAYGLLVIESDIERGGDVGNSYRSNNNFLLQYITSYFNLILEGKCFGDNKVLMGLYDYSIMKNAKNYPLFNEQLEIGSKKKREFINTHSSHAFFNRRFLKENKLHPLYLTEDEACLLSFNGY